MTCPLEIDIALWYWTRPGDYGDQTGDCNFTAPAVQETIADFVRRELLVHNRDKSRDCIYRAGPALEAWVMALLAVPFPVKQWVVPK